MFNMEDIEISNYDNQFIHKTRWMIQQIGLKTNTEVDVFAIIYAFSNGKAGYFSGSREYIADMINSTPKTAGKILSYLSEKGYIKKGFVSNKNNENNIKHPVYVANMEYVNSLRLAYHQTNYDNIRKKITITDKSNLGIINSEWEESSHYVEQKLQSNETKLPIKREETSHNSILYNKDNKKDIIEHDKPIKDSDTEKSIEDKPLVQKELFASDSEKTITVPPKKKQVKKSDFPPTVEEIDAYLREKDLPLDAFKIWQWYDTTNWCDKSGRKISNWKIKILNSWMSPKYHPGLVNKHYDDVEHTKPEVTAPKNEVSLPTAEENDAASKQVHEISEAGKKIQAMLRASFKNNG